MNIRRDANGDINYRAFFAHYGMNGASLVDACAMARERLNRLLGQRVRRELERMRYRSKHD